MSAFQEPWHVTDSIHNGKVYIGRAGSDRGGVALCQREEDAARIVACVNACEGITTERVEKLAEIGGVEGLTRYANALSIECSAKSLMLVAAERFIAGFEKDELQEGVDDLLAGIRLALTMGGSK